MKKSILSKKRHLAGLSLLVLITGLLFITRPENITAHEINLENNSYTQMNEQIHLIVSRTNGLSNIKMNALNH
jgi:sulfur transfer protein SufE